jgi:single-stranded-DNA-specific exonuclease
MRWITHPARASAAETLSRALNLPPLVAQLLAQRGIDQPDAAERFLYPALGHLHDPWLMAGMEPAVRRLRQAIERGEPVLIYGDYDVDGTMAVVVLLSALRALGGRVEAYIPNRFTDGYGMRAPVIELAASQGVRVVVSVDTGVRAHGVVDRARELGVDCIVTDHHLPEGAVPRACAVLNPHRPDCPYPEKNLCGAGVAFKLAQALFGAHASDRMLASYLKIVAIGTIADLVPLTGENRVIASLGLEGLRQPVAAGLRALLDVSGLAGEAVTAGDVGFRLAPRLNAAGRMHSAQEVIDLFLAEELADARPIAERLDRLNRERQQIEERILAEIVDSLEAHPEKVARRSLVLAGEGWHRGVIGIVAQRVVERYYRPALVIGIENGAGVGSGRSIPGFHLLEALAEAAELFDRFGGHAQAAGFSLPAERIPELERRFERAATARLRPEDLEPALRVDAEIDLDALDGELYEWLRRLAPHGIGNPAPVLAARALRILAPERILKEKHLKWRVAQGTKPWDAIWWGGARQAGQFAAGDRIDAAFTLDQNVFQGLATLQLIVKDARKCAV